MGLHAPTLETRLTTKTARCTFVAHLGEDLFVGLGKATQKTRSSGPRLQFAIVPVHDHPHHEGSLIGLVTESRALFKDGLPDGGIAKGSRSRLGADKKTAQLTNRQQLGIVGQQGLNDVDRIGSVDDDGVGVGVAHGFL